MSTFCKSGVGCIEWSVGGEEEREGWEEREGRNGVGRKWEVGRVGGSERKRGQGL